MPPAPRGQRRHRRQGGGGSSATASRGDSGDKRPSARELPPGRLFQRVGEKRQGREVILEEMEPQEARGEGLAARDGGGGGGAPAAGTEGTGGDRRDGGGGVGGPSAWSWELPARLDSHSSSQPRGLANPTFPRMETAVLGSAPGCAGKSHFLFQDPFALRASVNLRHSKRFNIPGSQGLASSPAPLQAQASPAKKAYFAPIYSPEPHFLLQFP